MAGHQQARAKQRKAREAGGRSGCPPTTPGVTGHLLVQGAPRKSVRARKYPLRHWQVGEPMVLEWLLAGHGWQDPSPDKGLKVPWAQAGRDRGHQEHASETFSSPKVAWSAKWGAGREELRNTMSKRRKRRSVQIRDSKLC